MRVSVNRVCGQCGKEFEQEDSSTLRVVCDECTKIKQYRYTEPTARLLPGEDWLEYCKRTGRKVKDVRKTVGGIPVNRSPWGRTGFNINRKKDAEDDGRTEEDTGRRGEDGHADDYGESGRSSGRVNADSPSVGSDAGRQEGWEILTGGEDEGE